MTEPVKLRSRRTPKEHALVMTLTEFLNEQAASAQATSEARTANEIRNQASVDQSQASGEDGDDAPGDKQMDGEVDKGTRPVNKFLI